MSEPDLEAVRARKDAVAEAQMQAAEVRRLVAMCRICQREAVDSRASMKIDSPGRNG